MRKESLEPGGKPEKWTDQEAPLSSLRGKVVQALCRCEMPRFYLSVVMSTRERACVSEDVAVNSSFLVT